MINRAQIEQLLKMNGVPVTAPDEEIKAVLLHASWHEKDVNTALLVLRENKTSHESHVDSLHKIFKSDSKLTAEAISNLLGIDVDVSNVQLNTKGRRVHKGMSFFQGLSIAFFSVFIAGTLVVGSMWYLQIGMFHIAFK
jgi:phosphoserine aminotransferase